MIPGLGRPSGKGTGNSLQYSCLEKSGGQGSLAGYSPQGHKESDSIEGLTLTSGLGASQLREESVSAASLLSRTEKKLFVFMEEKKKSFKTKTSSLLLFYFTAAFSSPVNLNSSKSEAKIACVYFSLIMYKP